MTLKIVAAPMPSASVSDRDEREARARDEPAETVSNVLPHVLQHGALLDDATSPASWLSSLIRLGGPRLHSRN